MADITKILADQQISIDAMLQKEPQEGEVEADIVILTHGTQEKIMDAAIASIESLPAITGTAIKIRMETLSR